MVLFIYNLESWWSIWIINMQIGRNFAISKWTFASKTLVIPLLWYQDILFVCALELTSYLTQFHLSKREYGSFGTLTPCWRSISAYLSWRSTFITFLYNETNMNFIIFFGSKSPIALSIYNLDSWWLFWSKNLHIWKVLAISRSSFVSKKLGGPFLLFASNSKGVSMFMYFS